MARAGLGEGWRCLFANDFDPAKARAYADNWGAAPLRCTDVATLVSASSRPAPISPGPPFLAKTCRSPGGVSRAGS